MLDLALSLAARGWHVLALHPIVHGRCACGLSQTRCRGAGKHPMHAAGRYSPGRWSCTSDPEVIKKIWTENPKAGVGIATQESGLLVLDFDSDDALNWIAVQEGRHGEIETYIVTTRKGIHVYLKAPKDIQIKSTVGALHRGVDTRAYGGYVVAEGSPHVSGTSYTVECDAPVADCPQWLLDMLRSAGCERVKRTPVARSTEAPSPLLVQEAKRICDHYVVRLEGRVFPGSVYGLLNEASFRLGQFVASGCLDLDYVRERLIAGLRAQDTRDVYLEKNVKVMDCALIDAEDQPDVPHSSAGVSVTRDDLIALARPGSVPGIVKQALRAGAKGEALCEPDHVGECLSRLAKFLSEKKPDIDPASIDIVFAQSLSLLDRHAQQRGLPPVAPDALSRRYVACLEKAALRAEAEPWRAKVSCSKDGTPKDSVGNIVLILREHAELKDLFLYDERTDKITYTRDAPWGKKEGEKITDHDYVEVCTWLTEHLGLSPRSSHVAEAVPAVAQRDSKDPVRVYLDDLEWDGAPRVDTWLTTYGGAVDQPFVRLAGAKWLISAVARAYRPGCKADYVLVLEGKQGIKKSTLLSTLAVHQHWFSDELHDLGSKGAAELLQGPWIVEISEIDRILSSRDAGSLKSFLSRPVDRYRAAYARTAADRPRKSIFVATTNDGQYLVDDTGDRRYWPIAITRCDVDAMARDRDQIWAEAVHRYRAGEAWWLGADQDDLATAEQSDRSVVDPWSEILATALAGRADPISTCDILSLCGVPMAQQHRSHSRRIGRHMRTLGWVYKAQRSGEGYAKLWCPP